MDGYQDYQEDQPMMLGENGGDDSTNNPFQGTVKHGRTGDYHESNNDNNNEYLNGHKQQRRRYDNNHQDHHQGIHGSRDCFEEVTAESCHASRLLRHDWFYEVPLLCRGTSTRASSSSHAQLAHEAHHLRQQLATLQAECQTLDQQLQQVKHRFQEAAERCAKAMDEYYESRNRAYEEQYEYYDNSDENHAAAEPSDVFSSARAACNPYEILGETRSGGLNHGLFLNRSAMKLANIDALLNFDVIGTCGTDTNKSTFYFADLCAAPGGFSEYILRRCCHALSSKPNGNISNDTNNYTNSHVFGNINGCRGFGMSLVGNNDQGSGTPWKLSQGPLLLGGGHDCRGGEGVYYYICHGSDGTGDIFHWPNVQCLQKTIAVRKQQQEQPTGILASTSATAQEAYGKVALVVADGGVDAQRNVSNPEAQTQKLVVCQVAAALSLLQPGGRLILKMLGCGGGASAGVLQCVMQDLYTTFDTIQVLKPISSRPASAERYLVCTGFQANAPSTVPQQQQQPQPLFDGPSWINRILLGRDIHVAPELSTFLARVDRDMLQLNLKACFAILSHLEAKTMRLTTASATAANSSTNNIMGIAAIPASHSNMMDEDEDEQWIQQAYNGYHHHGGDNKGYYEEEEDDCGNRRKVNVEEFRKAWKLFL